MNKVKVIFAGLRPFEAEFHDGETLGEFITRIGPQQNYNLDYAESLYVNGDRAFSDFVLLDDDLISGVDVLEHFHKPVWRDRERWMYRMQLLNDPGVDYSDIYREVNKWLCRRKKEAA